MRYAITFGQRYRNRAHPVLAGIHPDGWVEIEAKDREEAHRIAHNALGQSWSMAYPMEPVEDEGVFQPQLHPRGRYELDAVEQSRFDLAADLAREGKDASLSTSEVGKLYRGDPTTRAVRVVEDGGFRMLDPRNDVYNHSPDGFMWGYGGSGPAQLALALLLDLTEDDRELSLAHYQRLKEEVVSELGQDSVWAISARYLRRWLAKDVARKGVPSGV
jgi:hypothetical protein